MIAAATDMVPALKLVGGLMPHRRQEQCPKCLQRHSVFFAKHTSGKGIYHCHHPFCGHAFLAEHPHPLQPRGDQ